MKVDAEARRAKFEAGDVPPLRIEGVAVGTVRDFDLTVRPGEIVGLAGLPGSGVEDLFRCLSGERRPGTGAVGVGDRTITDPASALRAGVAFLPGSRGEATLAEEPVLENLALASLRLCASHGFMTAGRIRSFADPVIARLGLQPVAERRMSQLSGGNQQRVLVGSRILSKPHYLVLEDPTVGVDVAARGELHGLIADLAAEGMGVVVGSSDPQELVDICDSIIVLREGRGRRTLTGATATEFAVVDAMATTRGEHSTAGSRN
jgi:ABC-type sugar transport system ATPase subunit